MPNLLDIEWDAFEILNVPDLEIHEIVIEYHQTSMEDLSWVLYDILGDLILVVATLRWLLRVVVHVTLTPHVVAAFVVFLERFVEDPLTIVGFLVPRQKKFLVDLVACPIDPNIKLTELAGEKADRERYQRGIKGW